MIDKTTLQAGDKVEFKVACGKTSITATGTVFYHDGALDIYADTAFALDGRFSWIGNQYADIKTAIESFGLDPNFARCWCASGSDTIVEKVISKASSKETTQEKEAQQKNDLTTARP